MKMLHEPTLQEENDLLRSEVRVAREAADLTAQFVSKQFEETYRVLQKLEVANEYLNALHETTLSLMSRLDLTDLLHMVIKRAANLLGTQHGYVDLVTDDRTAMQVKVGIGLQTERVGEQIKKGEGISGHVWERGHAITINDYSSWEGRLTKYDNLHQVKAVTCVPLKSGAQILGVIGLMYVEPDRSFGKNEEDILERFAALVSIAIDNARLYEAVQTELEERRRVQSELALARDQAESANRAKSAFLATMSHEIRTPMNGIVGMTSLLFDTELTQEQREYAETIRNSTDSLLNIINDILDYSKIEAGKLDLEDAPFDLYECVEGSLDLVAPRAAEKGLDLAYMIDPQTPQSLVGDITRLRQILINLLSNAVKFTEKGDVFVSVDVHPDEDVPDDEYVTLHFFVQDTGIGIPPDRLDRLFKSFSQVDASTTRKYGGSGLGLAICKRLSELMDGRIWVESEVGKGTTFHFVARVKLAPAQIRTYLHTQPEQLLNKRVLIVDDNITNLRILSTQTRSWGMLPTNMESPVQALGWIQKGGEFDIALLDMQMPDMDGITLATEIRKIQRTASQPMVMLTSLGRKDARAADVNFAAYLYKPIRLSQLHNVLMEVFAQQSIMAIHKVDTHSAHIDSSLADRLPLRILLAEDHPVNQRLAVQILSKMGYRPDLAANGLEVLQALDRQTYDVILMDVQMPEMDGLEATRIICERYPEEGRPTIVAMTAEAMSGDREKCLAAGMDDYISKPIHIPELVAALTKGRQHAELMEIKQRTDEIVDEENKTGLLSELPSVDWNVIDNLRALQEDGMPDFVVEIQEMFVEETLPLLESIQAAVDNGDAKSLHRAAHTLKGNSYSTGAMRLGGLAFELEKIGKSGTVANASTFLSELDSEFTRVCTIFKKSPLK